MVKRAFKIANLSVVYEETGWSRLLDINMCELEIKKHNWQKVVKDVVKKMIINDCG